MEKRYKLLKDLPDVKAGAIFELVGGGFQPYKYINYETDKYYNTNILKNNPDWFAPYLFTTEDGLEYYDCYDDLDRIYWYVHKSSDKINWSRDFDTIRPKYLSYNEWRNSYKLFSTKEAAEEYLKSLTPQFKVGDIIVDTFQNRNRIGVVDNIEKLSFQRPYVTCKDQDVPYLIEHCRLATEEEVIKYYEQEGWVKGAKYREKGCSDIRVITSFEYDPYTSILWIINNSIPNKVEECELVKDPQYPKSWGELHLKGCQLGKTEFLTATHFDIPKVKVLQDYLIWSTKSQAKSALAFAQLTQLHAATIAEYNRVNNCDWKPDYSIGNRKWAVIRYMDHLEINPWFCIWTPLVFPTKELAQHALDNWKELWKQYYELL